ncbi:MAG: multifunctional oxoglutarate decarboxylase/oxoglutarate dehydrogenase thiamine pyrophosphate-binding subunit/dihydrolipoyllysine-residue succinyltransferase subunit, partial [Actinobacteria bacterium]|nr:multifunctional oxoglutarate decarboxylase/oxoglutarate dehydrogenase thiamine pyrophosphate-binding subunit/dihydrolipoyllysine-residue succinyltransferase subunit [Actinomycetota bacterium]
MTPENKFGGSFGSNEWLVDEMYERYLADPNSVEANWQEFFSGYKPTSNGAASSVAKAATPPIPKRQQVKEAPAQEIKNAPPPIQEVVRANPTPIPTPAEAIKKSSPQVATPTAARVEPLRGVSARVVTSMEASLTVPTATSVRAIPAKLMIDNRTVINNHLK